MATIQERRPVRMLPPRRPGINPELILGLICAGGLVLIALWWQDTGSIVGWAGWLTGAGRITGLLAGYSCAILLLLMARIPAVERGAGSDRLARWHAAGGRYMVCLALAHALLITWGYSLTAKTDVVSQGVTLVFDYPEMIKGTLGFLLIVGVGAISVRAARARMRYETWYYLHFSTYLAVYFVFSHQLALGADFVAHPLAQTFWYALYIGVAVLLTWFRFLTPIRRAFRHRMRVAQVRWESPGVVSVYITGHQLDRLGAEPGQFFRWRFLAPGMWWTASPYSLSAPAAPGHLRITVKEAGDHSAALASVRPGTRVWAEGPYGAFTAARRRNPKVLLLGAGVGITPLRTLFETLPGEVTMIYRARRSEDLALRGELDAIASVRRAKVHYIVDRPAGYSLTAEELRALVPDLAAHDVYVCGPPGMAAGVLPALRRAGVPRRRIHHESFEL